MLRRLYRGQASLFFTAHVVLPVESRRARCRWHQQTCREDIDYWYREMQVYVNLVSEVTRRPALPARSPAASRRSAYL